MRTLQGSAARGGYVYCGKVLGRSAARFIAAAYPHITIDVTVTDEEFDIVAGGYDAGVRLGRSSSWIWWQCH